MVPFCELIYGTTVVCLLYCHCVCRFYLLHPISAVLCSISVLQHNTFIYLSAYCTVMF